MQNFFLESVRSNFVHNSLCDWKKLKDISKTNLSKQKAYPLLTGFTWVLQRKKPDEPKNQFFYLIKRPGRALVTDFWFSCVRRRV